MEGATTSTVVRTCAACTSDFSAMVLFSMMHKWLLRNPVGVQKIHAGARFVKSVSRVDYQTMEMYLQFATWTVQCEIFYLGIVGRCAGRLSFIVSWNIFVGDLSFRSTWWWPFLRTDVTRNWMTHGTTFPVVCATGGISVSLYPHISRTTHLAWQSSLLLLTLKNRVEPLSFFFSFTITTSQSIRQGQPLFIDYSTS